MNEYYETTADKFVFKVKKGILYSRDEVWVKPESSGRIRVGVTDFAQRRGGDIVFVEAQRAGTNVITGGLLGSYETVKIVQDILSPINGDITETNMLLDFRPDIINRDPYGEGWLVVINSASSLERLLSAEEYFELMKVKVVQELKKIKEM